MKNKEMPFIFLGPLHAHLTGYIEYKRSLGFKIGASYYYQLRGIDLVAGKYGVQENIPDFTEPMVMSYVAKKNDTESPKTQHARMTTIRQFALYMNRLGYNCFVFPKMDIIKIKNDFIPYIFTYDEVNRLASVLDQITPSPISPQYHLIYPMLFRMLYGCGLRINEALALRNDDVDLVSGIIKITDSKNGEQRLLPMAKSLRGYCIQYKKRLELEVFRSELYYPSPRGGEYCSTPIYCQFRKFMTKAGIYRADGTPPRVHDIRHTFAVHSLEKMVFEGRDIYCALPYLSTYLGHRGIESTEKYLRLTKEAFESVLNCMERYYLGVFPEVINDEE